MTLTPAEANPDLSIFDACRLLSGLKISSNVFLAD
jgi:hypothetical protein